MVINLLKMVKKLSSLCDLIDATGMHDAKPQLLATAWLQCATIDHKTNFFAQHSMVRLGSLGGNNRTVHCEASGNFFHCLGQADGNINLPHCK